MKEHKERNTNPKSKSISLPALLAAVALGISATGAYAQIIVTPDQFINTTWPGSTLQQSTVGAYSGFLVALPNPPHVPVADAQYLRRLPPRDLLRHRLQHHVLYFHRPLHRGPRISFHAPHGLLSSPPAKRTYHLLSQPDISCATDIRFISA